MGKMIAREIDNLTWRVAGCLLFIGISAPAFHKFYRNGMNIILAHNNCDEGKSKSSEYGKASPDSESGYR